MKANNLTVSIPNKGCDKNCPYCVSKCTGSVKSNHELMYRNMPKVLNMARVSQVSSVLLTGKGEPCLNFDEILILSYMFQEFPVELQTNGIWLSNNLDKVEELAKNGMNVIAVSVDKDTNTLTLEDLAKVVHKAGMLLRVSFNVTKTDLSFSDLLYSFRIRGADQFTLRNIVAPNFTAETTQSAWIRDNVDPKAYPRLLWEMKTACKDMGHHLRSLAYGAEVYDLNGIAVSFSDYCIQDNNNGEDLRSLIYQEDGHCYTSWNSKASMLF